jgi:hypothetical protein
MGLRVSSEHKVLRVFKVPKGSMGPRAIKDSRVPRATKDRREFKVLRDSMGLRVISEFRAT